MNCKSIIFLVFASLAQCAFVSSLSVDFGLSDDSVASLITLIKYQDVAAQAGIDGFDKIFVKIEKEAAKLIHDLEDETDDDDSESSEPVVDDSLRNAINYSLDGFLLIVGEPCSVMEERRNTSYARFAKVSAEMEAAFELATDGDFAANRAQLETYQKTVLDYLSESVQSAYDALSTCLASSDAGVEAEIIYAREQSDIGLSYAADSIFNALKYLSVAITAGEADATLMLAIEECRGETQNIIRYDLQNKFAALKTILIATELGLTESIKAVSGNQYAWTLSSFYYRAGVDAIFDTILAHFQAVELGLSIAGRANLSQAEAAQNIQMSVTVAADAIFFESVTAIHPNATAAIEAAIGGLAAATKQTIGSFYIAVDAAQAATQNYSDYVEVIASLRKSGAANVDAYVAIYFDLLCNGETYDDASETELTTLKDEANEYFLTAMNSIFDGITNLTEVYHEADASEKYRTAILTAKESASSSVEIFAEKVSAAGIIVIQAKNNS